jgi:hypothetical protein
MREEHLMDPWVQLALTLQQELSNEFSRLTVATVIAEIRAEMTADGLGGDDPEVVGAVAQERLWDMLRQRRATEDALRPAGVSRRAVL